MSTLNEVLTDKNNVVSNSKEIAADLKQILASLMKVMENDEEIQIGDRRLFSLLLKNLRTKVQIELFNKLLDNNLDYVSLSATLEVKINDFKQELEEVREKKYKNLNYSSSQERVLERLIKSLEEAKKDVDEKNVISASTRLLQNYNVQEILDNCSTSLALGYMNFSPFFGSDMIKSSKKSVHYGYTVDFKTLEKVIEVIREDESVRKEIIDYYKYVQAYDKEKSILEENKSCLNLLKVVSPYVDKILELYKNSLMIGEKEQEKEHLVEVENGILKERKSLQRNIVSKLLNGSEIQSCDVRLHYLKQDLDILISEINDISKINKKIINQIIDDAEINSTENVDIINTIIHLKDYVTRILDSSTYELPLSYSESNVYYDRILSLFVDIIRGNTTFDKALERMNNLVEKSTKTLSKKENKKVTAYKSLSAKAREYANTDIYSAKACVDLLTCQPRYDRTPVICAFILHILGQTEKISFDDLLEVVNLAAKVDIEKIEEDYNNLIDRYINEVSRINNNCIKDYENIYKTNGGVNEKNEDTDNLCELSEKMGDTDKSNGFNIGSKVDDLPTESFEEKGEIPSLFYQEEYAPYTMPQMGESAYAKRVEVVDQYLVEKLGCNPENYDKYKLL